MNWNFITGVFHNVQLHYAHRSERIEPFLNRWCKTPQHHPTNKQRWCHASPACMKLTHVHKRNIPQCTTKPPNLKANRKSRILNFCHFVVFFPNMILNTHRRKVLLVFCLWPSTKHIPHTFLCALMKTHSQSQKLWRAFNQRLVHLGDAVIGSLSWADRIEEQSGKKSSTRCFKIKYLTEKICTLITGG